MTINNNFILLQFYYLILYNKTRNSFMYSKIFEKISDALNKQYIIIALVDISTVRRSCSRFGGRQH